MIFSFIKLSDFGFSHKLNFTSKSLFQKWLPKSQCNEKQHFEWVNHNIFKQMTVFPSTSKPT